jgi:hypothetical protein
MQTTNVSVEKNEKRSGDSVSGEAMKLALLMRKHADRTGLVEERWRKKFARIWGIFGSAGLLGTITAVLPKMPGVTEDDLKFLVETGAPKGLLRRGEDK